MEGAALEAESPAARAPAAGAPKAGAPKAGAGAATAAHVRVVFCGMGILVLFEGNESACIGVNKSSGQMDAKGK